jgi:DNA-binding transcriptional ArsR family regulator
MDGKDAGAIDRKAIKSLASDTRVSILKRLTERKKMPSELSREIGIAPSTVVEHLGALESAGLVRKEKTQRKWIYYELTEKGENIFRPKIPFQIILSLAIGLVITGISMWNLSLLQPGAEGFAMNEAARTADAPSMLTTAPTAAPVTAQGAMATTAAAKSAEAAVGSGGVQYDSTIVFASLAALGLLVVAAMLYSIYEIRRMRRN